MTALLGRVAFQLWILGFVVFFGAEVIHLEPGLRIVSQVLYGLPVAAWVALRLRPPWDRLDLVAAGSLLLYLVVCLTSRDRTESLGTAALVAGYVGLFLVLRREAAAPLRQSIVSGAALGLTITLLHNAWLLVQEKLVWLSVVGSAPLEGRLVFPWQTVNAMPVLVLLAIPFIAWTDPRALRLATAAGTAVAAVIVVPISMGRAGWLGLAVAAATLALLQARSRAWMRGRSGIFLAGGLGVIALVGIVAAAPALVDALGRTGRTLLWEQGMNLVADRPLVGSGPGTYSWARLEHGPPAARLLAVFMVHNTPLQTLVDGGIVLMSALLAATGAWAVTIVRRAGAMSRADRVAVAVLIGFAASTLLDDFSFNPSVTALVLATAAFVAPVPRPQPVPARRTLDALPLVAVVAVAILGLPGVVAVDAARTAGQAARTAAVEARWADAADAFRSAAERHPEQGGYWLGLGMAESHAGRDDVAIEAYRRATEASPGDARGYGGLAALTDDPNGQLELLRAAADRSIGDPQFAVRLGDLLTARGQATEAVAAWGGAVVLDPDLLLRLSYRGAVATPSAVAAAAIRTLDADPMPAPEANDAVRWDLALALDELPADAPQAWRAVDAARHGRLETARELALAAMDAAPHAATSHAALAMVAAYACDPATQHAAVRRLEIAGGSWPTDDEPVAAAAVHREFVYREAGLGPTQPAVAEPIRSLPWPWGLVPDPETCS